MKIAVSPDPEHWVVIPSFPPPGWAREEARRRAYLLGVTSPLWRNEFESLLGDLLTVERTESLARLLHAHSVRDKPFVVDMSLLRAGDNGTKEGRRRTQMGLVTDLLPGATPQRLRPGPNMAGFSAFSPSGDIQGLVVLRMAGLPTVPVDLLMRLWGAQADDIAPHLSAIVALARQVAPLEH